MSCSSDREVISWVY
jgi:hypothetical protein